MRTILFLIFMAIEDVAYQLGGETLLPSFQNVLVCALLAAVVIDMVDFFRGK